jgi:hypothetical protein
MCEERRRYQCRLEVSENRSPGDRAPWYRADTGVVNDGRSSAPPSTGGVYFTTSPGKAVLLPGDLQRHHQCRRRKVRRDHLGPFGRGNVDRNWIASVSPDATTLDLLAGPAVARARMGDSAARAAPDELTSAGRPTRGPRSPAIRPRADRDPIRKATLATFEGSSPRPRSALGSGTSSPIADDVVLGKRLIQTSTRSDQASHYRPGQSEIAH